MPRSFSSSSDSSNSSSCSDSPHHSKVLKVSNLSSKVNRNHLYEIFENWGEVRKVSLNQGKAYVEFHRTSQAAKALKGMHKGQIDGKTVYVSEKRLRRARSPRRSRHYNK